MALTEENRKRIEEKLYDIFGYTPSDEERRDLFEKMQEICYDYAHNMKEIEPNATNSIREAERAGGVISEILEELEEE
jgi:hypothetical protein